MKPRFSGMIAVSAAAVLGIMVACCSTPESNEDHSAVAGQMTDQSAGLQQEARNGTNLGLGNADQKCRDLDGDGHFSGCRHYTRKRPFDCDDSNPNVWASCSTCKDNDGDGYLAACDAYKTIQGPDCSDSDPYNWISCTTCQDADGDGFIGTGCDVNLDCNDGNENVYPGAEEVCDGIDNQCPGDVGYGTPDEVCSWAARYGDENLDVINAVQETSDGGYIAVGQAASPLDLGKWHLWVIKLDGHGNVLWERTFYELGGSAGFAVVESEDLGFIIGGYVDQDLGSRAALIAKISASGEMVWYKSFGDAISQVLCTVNAYDNTSPYNCTTTYFRAWEEAKLVYKAGNNYEVVTTKVTSRTFPGRTQYSLYEVDIDGNLLWNKTMPRDTFYSFNVLAQLSDGGWVMAGSNFLKALTTDSSFPSSKDIKITRLDQDLNILWSTTFGGTGDERPLSVHEAPDRGIVVSGITNSWGAGCNDYLLLKLDAEGSVLWYKTYGGEGCEGPQNGRAVDLEITADGGIALLGSTFYSIGEIDFRLFKMDSQGDLEWDRAFGGPGDDNPTFLRQTSDGGYILAGYKGFPVSGMVCSRLPSYPLFPGVGCYYPTSDVWDDAWVIKLDQNGNCFGPGCQDLAEGTNAPDPYLPPPSPETDATTNWQIHPGNLLPSPVAAY